jgi:hypothetical protein
LIKIKEVFLAVAYTKNNLILKTGKYHDNMDEVMNDIEEMLKDDSVNYVKQEIRYVRKDEVII